MRTIFVALLSVYFLAAWEPPNTNAADPTHDEAILALRRVGVKIGQTKTGFLANIDPESDDAPDEVFANLRFIKGLNDIMLSSKKGDERLALIADLPGIKYLSISRYVSDKGLKHLSKHTELKLLDIAFCDKVTDAGLVHLQPLTNLENLRLSQTKVTKGGINKLYKSLPKCLAELN